MHFDGRPFSINDAVENGVTEGAIREDHVVAQDTFSDCTDTFDRVLGARVPKIGLKLDADALEGLESMGEQEKFTLCIDSSALVVHSVPSTTDLQCAFLGFDFQVAGRTDRLIACIMDNSKGQVCAALLGFEQVDHPTAHVLLIFDSAITHVAPDALMQSEMGQVRDMLLRERLEANYTPVEGDGGNFHGGNFIMEDGYELDVWRVIL